MYLEVFQMGKKLVEFNEIDQDRKKKSKIITVMNNKGGCGKTTTALALGMYLSRTGKNVLFWDNDTQSNLTQRLGMSDEMHEEKRLHKLFENNGFIDDSMFTSICDYPYLHKIRGYPENKGEIGLMGGSHYSEISAKTLRGKLETGYGKLGHRDIFRFFRDSLNRFRNYYDYIIMDTAPALEGNELNSLCIRATDEIIYPIDGIDAALGVEHILLWMESQIKHLEKKPNGLFAMVKYQDDSTKIGFDDSTARVRNSVYRVLKESFGDFVCDNGVKELQSMRGKTAGFGKKTEYNKLCFEIIYKLSNEQRENLFEYSARNGFYKELQDKLSEIERKLLPRRPVFKKPKYTGFYEQKKINEE